jgi:group II intron reverse transcriptase/maturase
MVEIPKEDGSTRPLAISCLEDKIVQGSVTAILTAIYEPSFLPSSYGYRENIDGHEALRALMKYSNQSGDGATVEIDLRKYFNSIPHPVLMEILEQKISDKYFLKLIEKLIRTPIMENGKAEINRRGVPQGSIISPVLSNVYLHHVMDKWFDETRQSYMTGRAQQVRFADDMVFVFQHMEDALRFYKVLPKRLAKYGLELHEGKSSVVRSGSRAAAEAHAKGGRLPNYKFLGFTCYWGQSRNGSWRLKYKSRSDRMAAKLNGLKKYLRANSNVKTQTVIKQVKRVVKGWINYHAISDNQRRVNGFIFNTRHILFKWRNRKGGHRRLDWARFSNLLFRLEYPRTFKTKSMFATG